MDVAKKKNEGPSMQKNMGLFALGTVLTKVLSFCIAPVYSYYLSTADFGIIDLLSSMASLIYPMLTLAAQEAVLRYVLLDKENVDSYFTNGALIFLIGTLSLASAPLIIGIWYPANALSVGIYYVCYFLYTFAQVFSKSLNKTVSYSFSSLVYSLITVTSILSFLYFTDLGVNGYFYGMAIGGLAAFLYLFIRLHMRKYISFSLIKRETLWEMIRYAAPLILNNVSYWIISGSDKIVTISLMGEGAGGILSVVHKIPTLCTLAYSIFYDAYVIEALSKHAKTGDNQDAFYSSLFNDILAVLSIGIGAVVLLSYPIVLLYEQSYREAWLFIPLYSFGTVLGSIRGFYAPLFMINKKTGRLTCYALLGSLVNLISCYLLMKYAGIGLWATAVSTILGYGAISLAAIIDTRRWVAIKPKLLQCLALLVAFASCFLPCFGLGLVWLYVIAGISFLAILCLNFKRILWILASFVDDFRAKKGENAHE